MTILRGVTYVKDQARGAPAAGHVPILRATNIDTKLRLDDLVWVPAECVSDRQYLRRGDVVVAASSGSRAVVGKAAQLVNEWRGSFGAFCVVLRPVPQVDHRFVGWFLQTQEYRRRISSLAAGVNINNLRIDHIADVPFRLPPVVEQGRIVAEIEKLFSRLDAAEAVLKRVQANLRHYQASVLKAACEGRLVPTEAELARAEGRDYEPADQLLGSILLERRRRWEGIESSSLEARGKRWGEDRLKLRYAEPLAAPALGGLPEGWCWSTIDQLGFVWSGQTPKDIDDVLRSAGDIPWYRVGDMNLAGNERSMGVSRSWISCEDAQRLGLRVRAAGTIVFPKRGGAIATNKKRVLGTTASYDLNIMGIEPVRTIAEYLWWWFSAVDLNRLSDGSNVPQINHGDVKPLCVPVPPIVEQKRICTELERRGSLLDQVERAVEETASRSNALRRSILTRAFEGKLVPQDPSDEPASLLLERIGVERQTTGKGVGRIRAGRRQRRTKSDQTELPLR